MTIVPKTIQVKNRTYTILKQLKKKYRAKSFDEVIEKLILRELGLPDDMFGIDRNKVSSFSEKDRMEDREW